jgi:hypothetical protein
MEDGEAGFPNESLVFFNTTNVTFHGVLGRQTMTVPPGISGPFDLTQYFDSPVPIGLVVRDGDESHDVLLNRMRFYPGRRTVALLLLPKDPNSKRIRLRRLTELVQKEAYGVEEIQMADPAD